MASASTIPNGSSSYTQPQLFIGSIVSPKTNRQLTIIRQGLLGVHQDGTIAFVQDLDKQTSNPAHRLREEEEEEGSRTPSASDTILSSLSSHQRSAVLHHLSEHGWALSECKITMLKYGEFLCPGFIDTHTHACQVPNVGVGQQYELLDWLHNVTFPKERQFADVVYAEKTYNSVVQRLLDSGTTTACYFASLHLDATKILAKVCTQRGQRAMVGKCQMDRNSPADYLEKSAAGSVQDTKAFIKYCRTLHKLASKKERKLAQGVRSPSSSISSESSSCSSSPSLQTSSSLSEEESDEDIDEDEALMRDSVERLSKTVNEMTGDSDSSNTDSKGSIMSLADTDHQRPDSIKPIKKTKVVVPSLDACNALVQPIVTPRFAISCTDALLSGISALISRDSTLRIQTHLSESPGEIEFTRSLFPFAESYTHVYEHFNLLGSRTILAHCVHLSDEEMALIKARDSGVSHCPVSNMNIRSGASPVGVMMNRGIKVGLGTDVSGGYGIGMLSAIREASVVAKVLGFNQRENRGEITTTTTTTTNSTLPPASETSSEDSHDFTKGPLEIATLLWLATMGGAEVASISDRAGSLDVGKDFDALLVRMNEEEEDVEVEEEEIQQPSSSSSSSSSSLRERERERKAYSGNPAVYVESDESMEAILEKFLFTADDRNIARVYVRGRLVGGVEKKWKKGLR